MSRPVCCNGECNQGRACPLRQSQATNVREWRWIAVLILVVALAAVLGGCKREEVVKAEAAAAAARRPMPTYTDPETGCEYYASYYVEYVITPRMGRDGKQICGEVKP